MLDKADASIALFSLNRNLDGCNNDDNDELRQDSRLWRTSD
jgi:hypothetical protein